ncbi:MAG TPA: penicillin-binding transpeptidase domain-containing protein [Thermoleophilaceae bacterium]
MNRQITQLFAVVLVLFTLLVVFTSRWTVFEAKSLQNQTANRRPLLEELQIPRGFILADDGTRLAVNKRTGHGPTLRYSRIYPTNDLFSHTVGYSFISHGSSGLEKEYNDDLSGNANEFSSIIDELSGQKKEGNDLHTTLDPAAQKLALQLLAGRPGSVVVLDPRTGAVRVMASVPDYNPNDIPTNYKKLNSDPAAPLFNRATQGGYPPGSSMKVVTAVAALDTGRYTPDSVVSGKSPKIVGGVPLSNCCTEGSGNYGPLSLTEALAKSVNTVWGEVGEKLGKKIMFDYMDRFGFDHKPKLDLPSDELGVSGVYGSHGQLLGPSDSIDIGRVAIGQERLRVAPLQMAEVAAAVANGGKLMKPRLVDRIESPDGRTVDTRGPAEIDQVMKPSTAQAVTGMMEQVVKAGTATSAQIPGVTVAGKTGTAEVANGTSNQAWFIAFAPVPNPRVAIAVTVERTQGEGGTVAAPIAKQIIQLMLKENG